MRLTRITKTFGATLAVDDVSLDLERGEILALVGENGAGKTTLMRIATGELAADSGAVEDRGAVGFVHQHFLLVPELTIAENLALIDPRFRFATRRTLEREAAAVIASSGIELHDVSRRVAALSVGEKSKLELIKAIARSPSTLILDEPTSVLTPHESEELFRVMRTLAAGGTSIVFISHKLPEVLAVAQRVVVMRAGRMVLETRTASAEQLALAMTQSPLPAHGERGRGCEEIQSGPACERDEASCEAHRRGDAGTSRRRCNEADGLVPPQDGSLWISSRPLRVRGALVLEHDNLQLHAHETVAIIGVAGNGQSELARTLRDRLPHAAHIPEDRTRDGVIAQMTIAENLALRDVKNPAEIIQRYSIRAHGPRQKAGDLSGGNQQKVVLARELDAHPQVIVAAEPTRGLDLDATAFVHARLRDATASGGAVLLITSDLDEAFALADAMHVIYRGKLSERMTPEEASSRLANLMAGVE